MYLLQVQNAKSRPLKKIRIYQRPFHTLGVDYVGELPVSTNGNKWIINAVCPYSNFLRALPVAVKHASTAARALLDDVSLQYGFSTVLQSDQGGEWTNALFHHLTKILSIEHILTTSYHPRLNGSTERVHRWLNSAIGVYCEKYQSRWKEFLQPAVYAHNTSPIPGTENVNPFFHVFRSHAPCPETFRLELPLVFQARNVYAQQLVSRMQEAHKHFNIVNLITTIYTVRQHRLFEIHTWLYVTFIIEKTS